MLCGRINALARHEMQQVQRPRAQEEGDHELKLTTKLPNRSRIGGKREFFGEIQYAV